MKYTILILINGLLIFTFACEQKDNSKPTESKNASQINPAAKGFNHQDSDAKAISIADQVMIAMGGREAYDKTEYISWNFFGSRKLWWNKNNGDVRIESQKEDFKVQMNIHTMEGKVWKDSILLTQPDSLEKYLKQGKNIWINDSYWLVMPYKLKDSGVTLKYIGEENSDTIKADILELSFKEVGKTPENKYQVYVDKKTNLVNQWAFYSKATDEAARFVTPWSGYKKFENILLSGDRGRGQLTEIRVGPELADELHATLE